jgi:hypothetical protein
MQASKKGVAFTKAELRALREFSSKEPTDRDKFGVQLEISGTRCWARATNGQRCLEIDGESDGKHQDGEWFVSQKFLIDGRKELEGKQVLRLHFKGASLHDASIEENGKSRLTLTADADMSIAQTSFPSVAKKLKVPGPSRKLLHCLTLAEGHMHAVSLAALAVEDEMVEWFPPSDPDGMMVFRIASDKSTSIMGGIMLNASAEALKTEDDKEDEEKPKKKPKDPKQGHLSAVE